MLGVSGYFVTIARNPANAATRRFSLAMSVVFALAGVARFLA